MLIYYQQIRSKTSLFARFSDVAACITLITFEGVGLTREKIYYYNLCNYFLHSLYVCMYVLEFTNIHRCIRVYA